MFAPDGIPAICNDDPASLRIHTNQKRCLPIENLKVCKNVGKTKKTKKTKKSNVSDSLWLSWFGILPRVAETLLFLVFLVFLVFPMFLQGFQICPRGAWLGRCWLVAALRRTERWEGCFGGLFCKNKTLKKYSLGKDKARENVQIIFLKIYLWKNIAWERTGKGQIFRFDLNKTLNKYSRGKDMGKGEYSVFLCKFKLWTNLLWGRTGQGRIFRCSSKTKALHKYSLGKDKARDNIQICF